MKLDPSRPDWPERDRLLFSKGHACAVLCTALAHGGFFPVEELMTFCRFHSRLQGHPEPDKTPGVEVVAGPLGQGIAILRALPNMTFVAPSDPISLKKLLPQVAEWPGPVFVRLTRNEAPLLCDERHCPQIGKAVVLRQGREATLVGLGMMLHRCVEAAEILSSDGIEVRVIEMRTVKPLDLRSILDGAGGKEEPAGGLSQEDIMDHFDTARQLLKEFKGDAYLCGNQVLGDVGAVASACGRRAVLIRAEFPGAEVHLEAIRASLMRADVALVTEVGGIRPNAPREDLFPILKAFKQQGPDVIISFGGGSTIDATKAAAVLWALGGEIDEYFGTGLVTQKLEGTQRRLPPHVAIQTAASSGAHLTKYANITDLGTGQKKLIVDEAIVPARPVFDHAVTHQAPPELTADGALDGMAHILEVFYGAVGKPHYEKLCRIARTGISLIVNHLPRAIRDPHDVEAREALCLATDLGGYAIMLGGTNGGHLTSFSLVDILTHGRACALMNPYYTVFFAPAVEGPLRVIGNVFREAGFLPQDPTDLRGRDLGVAVAEAMFAFARAIQFPTTLGEVEGFTETHIERALTAAKNPQLRMKLENMPIPLTAAMIDEYMGPLLQAAMTGDLASIRNV